jgi:hypothetical protein
VTPPAPGGDHGSALRLIIGAGLLVAAVSLALIGFVRLIAVLEAGGYGTPAMRNALFVLGLAGGCLAGGIATLIWDIAKRFESPGEPKVGKRHSS